MQKYIFLKFSLKSSISAKRFDKFQIPPNNHRRHICGLSLTLILSLAQCGLSPISKFQFDQEWLSKSHNEDVLTLNRFLFIRLFIVSSFYQHSKYNFTKYPEGNISNVSLCKTTVSIEPCSVRKV